MSERPSGWATARLDEIADVRLGRQRSPKNHTGSRMRPYLRAANVTWAGLDLSDVKEMNFTEEESAIYELRTDDVLVTEASGSASEVGKPAIWRGEIKGCCFQNTLIRVRSRHTSPEFIRYFLLGESRSGRIGRASPGVGIHHIGSARLSAWPVSLPPLNEQRRIVDAIEAHLSRLDAADGYLAASSERLNALRAASLHAALRGEWPTRSLGDIALTVRNGIFVSRPATSPPGVPIFRISAVRPMALDVEDIRYADVEPSQAEPFLTREDDLLFTRYSGNADYVGACARVPRMSEAALHPDKLIRVVVDTSQAEPAFVELACSAGVSREAIRSRRKTTAGQVGIAGGQLRTVPIPLPPLTEQRRIVARVEEQLSAIDALRTAIERARRRSASLRRAVLERAFRGELVPQDPSDEPASELLERIQAERAAAPPPSRRRRVSA